MAFTDLDQANEDARYRIYTYSRELDGSAKNDPPSLFAIAWEHRQAAICSLLQKADVVAYQTGLRRAGSAWMHLLALVDGGMVVPARMLIGSRWMVLASVAASNDLPQGRELALRFPQTCDMDREYADQYFPLALLSRALISPTADDLISWCARWETALDGGTAVEIDAWRAIANIDAPAFADAFAAWVSYRMNQMAAYRSSFTSPKTIAAAESGLFINGLAMLQIARSRGLTLPPPQPMCPAIALVSQPTASLPKDAWKQLD